MRRLVDADVDAAHVFADEPEQEHDHAAHKQQRGEHAGVAHGDRGVHEFLINYENAGSEPDYSAEDADEGRGAERLDGKRGESVNPEPDEPGEGVARFALDAAAVFNGDVAEVLGRAENEPADVGKWVGVAHDLVDDELAHDKETRGAQRLGLTDNVLGHLLVDPGAKAAEQVLLGVLVVAVHHVVAFFQLVDQLERLAGGGLSIVIEAYHVIAGGLRVACHERAVLPEVLGEADSFDVAILLGELPDGLPHVVGAAVVHEYDFVVENFRGCAVSILGRGVLNTGVVRGDGLADFLHDGANGIFAAVAGNHERDFHTFSHLLLWAERAAACIMARPSSEVRMPQTYWLVKLPVSKYCPRQSAISL